MSRSPHIGLLRRLITWRAERAINDAWSDLLVTVSNKDPLREGLILLQWDEYNRTVREGRSHPGIR